MKYKKNRLNTYVKCKYMNINYLIFMNFRENNKQKSRKL